VKTVLPFFAAWMLRFPDFATLEAASEADVLRSWEGLGYYNRARNLHRHAMAISAMHATPLLSACDSSSTAASGEL
jgi:A/G-specific adenine glycosylase